MGDRPSVDIRALNAASPFHRLLGAEVTRVASGEVEVVLPFSNDLLADVNTPYIHGGAIASLIDIAGDFAIIAAVDRDVPTIDLRIDYLRPANPGRLTAVARAVKVGRNLGIADVEVFDEAGQMVALGRGLFSTR